FTDKEQIVTYVYTKNNVTPSPKPDDHSDIPKSNKDTNNQTKYSTEDVSKLPQTGENESLSLIGMIFGPLLILGTTLM
ncbi:cell surface protein, partial [Bacillus cereus]|uniref:LPXTG cell wall anchor domain-containing protein n=1 Tax=Bacillus cereus TaxID=1396 RepID=UPI000BEBBC09